MGEHMEDTATRRADRGQACMPEMARIAGGAGEGFGGLGPQGEAWLALSRLHATIADALERALQARHSLSVSEFAVLHHLSRQTDHHLRMQQLAEAVGLHQSAVSRLVARLEAESCGLLQRYLCLTDRRGVYTELTEEGARRLIEAIPTYQAVLASAVADALVRADLPAMCRAMQPGEDIPS